MTIFKILLLTISPPENDCGCRVVLYRHLVERGGFQFIVATRDKWVVRRKPEIELKLPYVFRRIEKSRYGPALSKWIRDYENLIWPYSAKPELFQKVEEYKPDVVLNLADPTLSPIALRISRKYNIPLVGMFNDLFPIMPAHYGHSWTKSILLKRYKQFYKQCDLAFCTSDGMKEYLGKHRNSHVLYPIPGKHKIPKEIYPPKTNRSRLVYVGSAEGFYGRMLCRLIQALDDAPELELKIVTPNNDWPTDVFQKAKQNSIYLGFYPPDEAAKVIASADALLVLMSFEKEHELFMRTSFTTKFLDYSAFGKPIILWGPDYCTPATVVLRHGGAIHVNKPNPDTVLKACSHLSHQADFRDELSNQAIQLHKTLFNPELLQNIFVREINRIVCKACTSE